ncbi:uncharacterized protein proca1 [Antennarius striatus]|uniref:uncharacterized protein proca1 n=1 Tax=Antennarius striatus TaxID=241820 RepID=UPI0035B2A58F
MWSVLFVFLSYLDRNFVKGDHLSRALDAEEDGKGALSLFNATFCAKLSPVRGNLVYQVSDGAEVVHAFLSPDKQLVNCSITMNQKKVKLFMRQCILGLKDRSAGQVDARFVRLDEAKRMCREFKERPERIGVMERKHGDEAELQDKVVKRSKRGFTYPGTLWCGAGNMADHYDQLGEFAQTDSCCRIHDHCPHVIHAFSSKYGYTNFKWHSICHCTCDNTLKDCLRKVNDTSSRVVGQAFFNVIGVPCFEFTYEERCAERHWYGMCKRYEKVPIAVIHEAVPYDFGGIDIIDELPLPPPKKAESKEKDEEDIQDSTAQPSMSGPDEPSLRNVVTAAEDFIKVLATVSTSQSSTTDSDKGETQSSDKKKRKNTGKKKKTGKKRKGKGKGRKRKQKTKAGDKIEDGTAVPTTGSKSEELKSLNYFIIESRKHEESNRNTDRVSESGYELGGKEEPSNEVMKDEPAMDKETVSMRSPVKVQKKQESAEEIPLSRSVIKASVLQKSETGRLREGRRKKSQSISSSSVSSSEELEMNKEDISVPTTIAPTLAAQPQQQSFSSDSEKPVDGTERTPIKSPKVKRNRSKDRRDREGRKKRRKDSLVSPIVGASNENSSVDILTVIPLTMSPTVSSVPTTGQTVSQRGNIYLGTVTDIPLNTSFSIQKRNKSQKKRLKSVSRERLLLVSDENTLFYSISENIPAVLPTPAASDALISPATPGVIIRPTEETQTDSERRIFITNTMTSVVTKRRGRTNSRQRKHREKASSAALTKGEVILKLTEQTPMTFTVQLPQTFKTEELDLQRYVKTPVTTSTTAVMSPVQLSIERIRAQFSRKKRRKAALSRRPH